MSSIKEVRNTEQHLNTKENLTPIRMKIQVYP